MTTEMITLKLEREFLKKVDTIVDENYQNRTEFIRDALREKIEEINMKKAMIDFLKLKGTSKNKISDEAYEKARSKAFAAMSKKFR